MKEKSTAGMLALFLGGVGAHKFYLGKTGQGVLYLLFFWTFIPAFIALAEGIIYLTESQQAFDAKYNPGKVSSVVSPESSAPVIVPPKPKAGAFFVSLIIVFIFIAVFSSMQMSCIKTQVGNDMIEQYNLARKGGDKIEICVHAGLVVAAMNQAHDEEGYLKWKQIQRSDCGNAGMPGY